MLVLMEQYKFQLDLKNILVQSGQYEIIKTPKARSDQVDRNEEIESSQLQLVEPSYKEDAVKKMMLLLQKLVQ